MIYEVRFQTVDPARREEYVKHYKQAIQEIKQAGCKGGQILCSESDPSAVLVLLEWETKEHHLRWRGTPPHQRFRAAMEDWQTKPSQGGYYVAESI
jgi:heme-degrading monooxygenase HmoA